MKTRVLLATVATVIVGVLSTASAANARGLQHAIDGAWRVHIQGAIAKDMPRVMEMFDRDCIYFVPGEADLRGHDAIAELEKGILAAVDLIEAYHTTDDLQVYGDLGYELGTVRGHFDPHGDEPPVWVTFHYMAQWGRDGDGMWRIRHFVGKAEPLPSPND